MIDFNISNKLTDDLVINNNLLYVLQQIDLLFDTDINDVIDEQFKKSAYGRHAAMSWIYLVASLLILTLILT